MIKIIIIVLPPGPGPCLWCVQLLVLQLPAEKLCSDWLTRSRVTISRGEEGDMVTSIMSAVGYR